MYLTCLKVKQNVSIPGELQQTAGKSMKNVFSSKQRITIKKHTYTLCEEQYAEKDVEKIESGSTLLKYLMKLAKNRYRSTL